MKISSFSSIYLITFILFSYFCLSGISFFLFFFVKLSRFFNPYFLKKSVDIISLKVIFRIEISFLFLVIELIKHWGNKSKNFSELAKFNFMFIMFFNDFKNRDLIFFLTSSGFDFLFLLYSFLFTNSISVTLNLLFLLHFFLLIILFISCLISLLVSDWPLGLNNLNT